MSTGANDLLGELWGAVKINRVAAPGQFFHESKGWIDVTMHTDIDQSDSGHAACTFTSRGRGSRRGEQN